MTFWDILGFLTFPRVRKEKRCGDGIHADVSVESHLWQVERKGSISAVSQSMYAKAACAANLCVLRASATASDSELHRDAARSDDLVGDNRALGMRVITCTSSGAESVELNADNVNFAPLDDDMPRTGCRTTNHCQQTAEVIAPPYAALRKVSSNDERSHLDILLTLLGGT
jgi:hypothetical protein